jgi:AraC-like DNA-binding protein
MDILTDILNTAGLKKKLLNSRSLYEPWSHTFPCNRSIGFHVVTQGTAYLWQADRKEPIVLQRGDIAFMARGMVHHITTHPNPSLIDPNADKQAIPASSITESPLLTLVSGAYQLWNDPIHQLFNDLPEWKIIRGESVSYSDSLQNCLQILSSELGQPGLGSETIIASLLDVMLNMILRRILENSVDEHSIGIAFRDPVMNKALQLMHSEPDKDWTVEQLAEAVGLSRSGFSLKFKQILGDTPLSYLTNLRIFKASELLSNTDYTLEKISRLIGYKDAFSFSKTFKRITGISPKTFREKNEDDKKLVYYDKEGMKVLAKF